MKAPAWQGGGDPFIPQQDIQLRGIKEKQLPRIDAIVFIKPICMTTLCVKLTTFLLTPFNFKLRGNKKKTFVELVSGPGPDP